MAGRPASNLRLTDVEQAFRSLPDRYSAPIPGGIRWEGMSQVRRLT